MTVAAILGSLVDAKNVAVHKTLRLSIDVPVERAQEVLKAFGWPTMVNPVAVAIARIDESKVAKPVEATPAKERRSWNELGPAQQAGIRCGEPSFQAFIAETFIGEGLGGAEHTAEALRRHLGVKSRKDINTNIDAIVIWRSVEIDYQNWLRGAV